MPFRYLLGLDGIELGAANRNGFNALHRAAFRGHLECVEILLGSEGFPVDVRTPTGVTALMMAAQSGRMEASNQPYMVYSFNHETSSLKSAFHFLKCKN